MLGFIKEMPERDWVSLYVCTVCHHSLSVLQWLLVASHQEGTVKPKHHALSASQDETDSLLPNPVCFLISSPFCILRPAFPRYPQSEIHPLLCWAFRFVCLITVFLVTRTKHCDQTQLREESVELAHTSRTQSVTEGWMSRQECSRLTYSLAPA